MVSRTSPPRCGTEDAADHGIPAALERDGRLSYADLAEQIDLSKTANWGRVRRPERKKVITGYRAEIQPAQLGLDIHAFVQVTIKSHLHAPFEQAVMRHPAVLECYTTVGLKTIKHRGLIIPCVRR